jgi:hypothetical protein
VKRGLKIECKCPQKPDTVLRKKYGVKVDSKAQSVTVDESDDSNDEDQEVNIKQPEKTTGRGAGGRGAVARGASGRGAGGRGAGGRGGRGVSGRGAGWRGRRKINDDTSSSSSPSEDEEAPSPITGAKRGREEDVSDSKNNNDHHMQEMKAMLAESQRLVQLLSAKVDKQELQLNENKVLRLSNESAAKEFADNAAVVKPASAAIASNATSNLSRKDTIKSITDLIFASINHDNSPVPKTNDKGLYNFVFQAGMNFSRCHELEDKCYLLEDQLQMHRRNQREANYRVQLQRLLDELN